MMHVYRLSLALLSLSRTRPPPRNLILLSPLQASPPSPRPTRPPESMLFALSFHRPIHPSSNLVSIDLLYSLTPELTRLPLFLSSAKASLPSPLDRPACLPSTSGATSMYVLLGPAHQSQGRSCRGGSLAISLGLTPPSARPRRFSRTLGQVLRWSSLLSLPFVLSAAKPDLCPPAHSAHLAALQDARARD